jgi:membrane-bound serine protease (ClpP class)
MLCHLPFIVPVAGLVLFAVLPLPTALAIYVPVALLALAIGIPAVRAMYRPVATGVEAMRGTEGIVLTAEGRSAAVRWEGEIWNCRAAEPLAAGDRVRIVEVDGLTAVVRRADGEWRMRGGAR